MPPLSIKPTSIISGETICLQRQRRKILIVDDHLFNIEAIKIILQCKVHLDVDFVCDIAMDGAEAIEVILNDILILHNGERSSYALILMDCQMPVMDGFECAREIRRYLKKYKLP